MLTYLCCQSGAYSRSGFLLAEKRLSGLRSARFLVTHLLGQRIMGYWIFQRKARGSVWKQDWESEFSTSVLAGGAAPS